MVRVLTILVGVAADLLLFFLCFRLLGRTEAPRSALWQGALLGALAFEVLKQLSNLLLQSTQGNPAFQAFGIALIILVWINYFSRIVLYAAAFAHTAPAARADRPPASGRRGGRVGGGEVRGETTEYEGGRPSFVVPPRISSAGRQNSPAAAAARRYTCVCSPGPFTWVPGRSLRSYVISKVRR